MIGLVAALATRIKARETLQIYNGVQPPFTSEDGEMVLVARQTLLTAL